MEKTLHKDLYFEPDWFKKECENIFHKEWFCCGREEDIPDIGNYKVINIGEESIFLLRSNDQKIRAFFNFCKHRGCQLLEEGTEGRLKRNIICPYHSWTYNFDGSIAKTPHLDVDLDNKKFHLNQVKLDTWGGFIILNLGGEGHLDKQIGNIKEQFKRYPLDELLSSSKYNYSVQSNWKVIIENYNECYHCAGIHPELCQVVPAFKENGGSSLNWETGIPQREGTNTFTFTGTTNRPPFPGLNDDEKEKHFGQAIYPNLLISLSMDHVAAFIVSPEGPDRTSIDCRILFHPESTSMKDFDPSDAAEFWHMINKQDWNICEKVQKGMNSSAFEYGFYGEMEDENLDIRKYISEKLDITFD